MIGKNIIHDEVFGALQFDERAQSYEAVMELAPGRKIAVTIEAMGIASGTALERAQQIYKTLAFREQAYRHAVASRLLDLYNGSWRDGEALDLDGFMRRVSISSVSIAPLELGETGCATLYYADDGLFAGHFIEVSLDSEFNFSNAQLAG